MTFLLVFLLALQGSIEPALQYQAGTACSQVVAGWNNDRTEAILITLPKVLRSLGSRAIPVGTAGTSVRIVQLTHLDAFAGCGEDLGESFETVLGSREGWLASSGSMRVSVSGRFPFGSVRIELRDAVFVDSSGHSTRPRSFRFTAPINDTVAG